MQLRVMYLPCSAMVPLDGTDVALPCDAYSTHVAMVVADDGAAFEVYVCDDHGAALGRGETVTVLHECGHDRWCEEAVRQAPNT